ncbi:MAG: hypothetical protein NTW68_02555 [candidate division NC10 bacterium]|nr:hypothetical protein [candidate division NC10 bacterium]
MLTRLRIGGVTLALHSERPSRAISPTAVERGFVVRSGAEDIVLDIEERPVPDAAPESLLFDSGGPWCVHARGRRYLYSVRESGPAGPVARGIEIDRGWRRGVLYLPPSPRTHRLGDALSYPLGELLFTHHITASDGVVAHACGVGVGGKGVLFCGVSGAGKTTMARLWNKHRPDATILSDDRVVVRWRRGRFWVWGTPWHGTGRFASPRAFPLQAIFFLTHDRRNTLTTLDQPTAAARLLARSFPPIWSAREVATALRTVTRLAGAIPCYSFGFRIGRAAVESVLERLGLARDGEA